MSLHAVNLALLPLENLSGLPEDERLARGFSQDLITELARFPALGVIALDSVSAAGAMASDLDLGVRLGAQFLLKGSVRRSGSALRLSVQLIEAATGRHYWAGRYDEDCLPTLQDEIAARVANALAIQVDRSVLTATRRRKPTTLEAYECWLRGMESLHRGSVETDGEARRFFEQALESDAGYARAYAGLSLTHFNEWSCQAWERWEEKERLAYEHAARAESLDPDDAVVQVILGRIEQYRREFARVAPRLARARALAPNDANILIQLSSCHAYQGDTALALELAQRALALNPLCPNWFYCYAALPPFVARQYEESLEKAGKAPPSSMVDLPAYKAAALAYIGKQDEASEHMAEFRRDFSARIACGREPEADELLRWTLHVNPYCRDEDRDHFAEGLRRAGLADSGTRKATRTPMPWPIANAFRREGAMWTLAYEGQVVQLADMRGLNDIARLLAEPGVEVSSVDLSGAAMRSGGLEKTDLQALQAYRSRIREIEAELEEAADDMPRAAVLEEEREGILREIRGATGLGGRTRRTGDTGERSRTAVTWRIRHAIRKVGEVHVELGRHLAVSTRTGAFCCYEPERDMVWRL